MTNEEKLSKIAEKLAVDKGVKEDVKKQYADKDKIKKLTDKERLSRIEEFLNISGIKE